MIFYNLFGSTDATLEAHGGLDLSVKDQHQGRADGTESVGSSTLEKGSGALLLQDLPEAVNSSGVKPLRLWLLGLHLQTSADGIERVGSITGSDGGNLGNGELGGKSNEAGVLSERVDAGKGIVHTEVDTSVWDDTSDGDTEAVVKTHEAGRTSGSLDKAVTQAVERSGTTTDIGSKSGTGIVQRIDNAQGTSTGKTSGSHVDKEEHAELSLGVVLREKGLDGVLEGEVKGLGREITDHVGEISSPESLQALLLVHTGEAVSNTGVTLDSAGLDQRIGILGLDDQFDSLDRSSSGLGNGT